VFQFTVYLTALLEPVALPIRFFGACSLLGLCGWSLFSTALEIVARAKQMHRVPCTKCRFFTQDYRLKCTVQPHIANTEQAINCSDYLSNR
jgi:hypothetical protein